MSMHFGFQLHVLIRSVANYSLWNEMNIKIKHQSIPTSFAFDAWTNLSERIVYFLVRRLPFAFLQNIFAIERWFVSSFGLFLFIFVFISLRSIFFKFTTVYFEYKNQEKIGTQWLNFTTMTNLTVCSRSCNWNLLILTHFEFCRCQIDLIHKNNQSPTVIDLHVLHFIFATYYKYVCARRKYIEHDYTEQRRKK